MMIEIGSLLVRKSDNRLFKIIKENYQDWLTLITCAGEYHQECINRHNILKDFRTMTEFEKVNVDGIVYYDGFPDATLSGAENENDNVNHPNHYNHGGVETIEIIKCQLTHEEFKGYLKGNILKYRDRHPYKGKAEEDLAKAKWYYDRLMAEEENDG